MSQNGAVIDAAQNRLRGLTQLRHLGLIETGVSKQAVRRLPEAISALEVQTTNPFDEAATAKDDIGLKCPVARCHEDLCFVDDGKEGRTPDLFANASGLSVALT